jgi:hypothetical protein
VEEYWFAGPLDHIYLILVFAQFAIFFNVFVCVCWSMSFFFSPSRLEQLG